MIILYNYYMTYQDIKDLVKSGWKENDPVSQASHLNQLMQNYAYLMEEKGHVEDRIRQKSAEYVGSGLKQCLCDHCSILLEYRDAKDNFLAPELKDLGEIEGLLKVISKQQEALITIISLHKTELMQGTLAPY